MTYNLPDRIVTGGLGTRPSREAARLAQQILDRTALAAAELQGAEYVTDRALHAVANISDTEARLLTRSPLAEARLQLVADTGSGVVAALVARYLQ